MRTNQKRVASLCHEQFRERVLSLAAVIEHDSFEFYLSKADFRQYLQMQMVLLADELYDLDLDYA